MGKHSDKQDRTATDHGGGGKHRIEDKTVDIRVDTDSQGRVTGWGVGRDPGPDNYDR